MVTSREVMPEHMETAWRPVTYLLSGQAVTKALPMDRAAPWFRKLSRTMPSVLRNRFHLQAPKPCSALEELQRCVLIHHQHVLQAALGRCTAGTSTDDQTPGQKAQKSAQALALWCSMLVHLPVDIAVRAS